MFQKLDIDEITSSKFKMVVCQVFLGERYTIDIVNVYNADGNEPQTEDVFNKVKK